MKKRVKQKNMAGRDGVRVNQAGCLDRCDLGPVMVIYPEGVWYTYLDEEDIDEIIDQHLQGGTPVRRLMLDRE